MTARRLLWIVVPMLLLVVLAGGGALAWLMLRSSSQPARLVVLGPDKQIRLLDADGGARVLAENAKTDGFSFPATAPDQRHLAFVTEDDNGAAIILLDVVSGERKELYHSRESVPIDLAWSPDGKYIVFLAGGQLTAQIVPADGSLPAQLIAAGAPSYFAWSPDSSTLLLHLGGHTAQGGHVVAYRPGEAQVHPLLSDPGFFQAPAWAINGQHFFYVAQPPFANTELTINDILSTGINLLFVVSFEQISSDRIVRKAQCMLHITFSEQDIADLRYERYHHPHPRVQMKMEALLLKSRNLPHHEIAACVGVSEPTLRTYFRTYLAGGIAALREVHFYRPESDLERHRTTLEAYFTAHPPANATQAAAAIEELTGIKRSPTQIRIFLKKLGLKRLKTYAIPAKYDQERQETFKKTNLSHG